MHVTPKLLLYYLSNDIVMHTCACSLATYLLDLIWCLRFDGTCFIACFVSAVPACVIKVTATTSHPGKTIGQLLVFAAGAPTDSATLCSGAVISKKWSLSSGQLLH
jgi:hypothetical protein